MQNPHPLRHLRIWFALTAILVAFIITGCSAMDQLSEALYPTEALGGRTALPQHSLQPVTPLPKPSATPLPAPTFTWPVPTHTPIPQPPKPPSATPAKPTVEAGPKQHLIFAKEGSIYRGNYWGDAPIEVALVPQLEAWAFATGKLAIARGKSIELIDLSKGTLQAFNAQVTAPVAYAQVIWGSAGNELLYAATIEDKTATSFGRSVELHAISPLDGRELGKALVHNVTSIRLLRYDEPSGLAYLLSFGEDRTQSKLEIYNVRQGKRVQRLELKGEEEAVISPDGHYLLTEGLDPKTQRRLLRLYDISQGGKLYRSWSHPPKSHSVAHIWAPDGRYVAYLLQEGLSYDSSKGLGIWVLEVATMQAHQVLEENAPSSSLVSWTPDSRYIIGYHRGAAGEAYFYAVRPDGGDRRILPLPSTAQLLGWMELPGGAPIPKVTIDPWRVRFLDTQGDPASLAQVVAEFVAAQPHTEDKILSQRMAEYLRQAGWEPGLSQPQIKRLSKGLFIAQLPPFSICLLEGGKAQVVANGNVILDARLEGNDLGLIFGVISANAVQPAFELLRRQEDGSWRILWTPQGHRDWVTTDGEIQFVGKGLETLRVRGSSFGLDLGEDQVFSECHACPHRWLMATWVRQGDRYVRESKLPAGASLGEIYWEMTELRPYAILYESLRRMRQGLPVDELVASPAVTAQAQALGLLEKGLLLYPQEERPDSVLFSDLQNRFRYIARIQGGKVLSIEPLK